MADTGYKRTLAAIDRNIGTCRAALAVEHSLTRRSLIKALIDSLLEERAERHVHCSICQGEGRLLPGGACSLCDRRRCMLKDDAGKVICTEYVENIYATKCPKGHVLPGR